MAKQDRSQGRKCKWKNCPYDHRDIQIKFDDYCKVGKFGSALNEKMSVGFYHLTCFEAAYHHYWPTARGFVSIQKERKN